MERHSQCRVLGVVIGLATLGLACLGCGQQSETSTSTGPRTYEGPCRVAANPDRPNPNEVQELCTATVVGGQMQLRVFHGDASARQSEPGAKHECSGALGGTAGRCETVQFRRTGPQGPFPAACLADIAVTRFQATEAEQHLILDLTVAGRITPDCTATDYGYRIQGRLGPRPTR